ncbi:ABC transporter ATP-binding protein [Proteiniclasticum sp.]|uniref:ABC transporter ATP-binding protein n=1 Tax=Proteiniclasticum sp. TaxID=2053595 RepID=UPI00289BE33C|nr:ABC transporter ATP-binding protein [Proteiniclasticum sp.]
MTPAIIELKNLEKSFGKVKAVDDLTLSIPSGKIIGLLGPNGSGKSTLFKLINGLLQPTKGSVLIDGLAPSVESKKIISYLPERTYLNDWMKVRDIFDFFNDFYEDFDRIKAKEMLSVLKLDENYPLKTLSKGNKEKVQLILVMSRKSKVYLLDEPIGGVDPAARDFILETILSNYKEDATMIISTHLISDIEKVFDEVILLNQGRLYDYDSVDSIREKTGKSVDELFREVFRC